MPKRRNDDGNKHSHYRCDASKVWQVESNGHYHVFRQVIQPHEAQNCEAELRPTNNWCGVPIRHPKRADEHEKDENGDDQADVHIGYHLRCPIRRYQSERMATIGATRK